jgi:hypothetical protein
LAGWDCSNTRFLYTSTTGNGNGNQRRDSVVVVVGLKLYIIIFLKIEYRYNMVKGFNGLNYLLPAVIGAGIGVFLFKMQSDKEVQRLQASVAAAQAAQQTRGGLSNSLWLSYNTTPYFLDKLPTTTEWNPENLNFSGSISDAGFGYTFVIPKSAM